MVALLHAPVGEDGGAVCFHSRNVAQNHGSHAECANAVRGGAGRFFGILSPVDIAADIHGSGGQQRVCRGNNTAQHGEQGNECYEGDYAKPGPEHMDVIVGNIDPVCQARPLAEEIWCVEEGDAVASC